MAEQDSHPFDRQLLSYLDNELSSNDVKRLRAHLGGCHKCRARIAEMEVASSDFMQVHRENGQPEFDISGPRALLRARLSGLSQSTGKGRKRLNLVLDTRGLICVCALGIFAILGTRFIFRHNPRHADRASALAGLLPDPNLTPGSTRQATLANLCSSDRDDEVRAVPVSLGRKVFAEYGMQSVPKNNYEVDYLITPGLGGSDDIRNLWPEPHDDIVWNSYVKDQLENHLHHMVCDGELSLVQAQKEIATNWIAAYKKYFHTDRPLPNSSSPIAFESSAILPIRESRFFS